MAKPKKQTFTVHARLTKDVTAIIEAESFADAFEIANNLDIFDLEDVPGELLNSSVEITAVLKD